MSVMGKHFTNIKKMHNHLSPRTIEHKNEIQLLACERHKYVMGLHQLIGSPSPSWQFDLQQQYNHFILDSSHDGMIPFTKSHNVGSLLRFCDTIWLKIYEYFPYISSISFKRLRRGRQPSWLLYNILFPINIYTRYLHQLKVI